MVARIYGLGQYQARVQRLKTPAARRRYIEWMVPAEYRDQVKAHLITVYKLKRQAKKNPRRVGGLSG